MKIILYMRAAQMTGDRLLRFEGTPSRVVCKSIASNSAVLWRWIDGERLRQVIPAERVLEQGKCEEKRFAKASSNELHEHKGQGTRRTCCRGVTLLSITADASLQGNTQVGELGEIWGGGRISISSG